MDVKVSSLLAVGLGAATETHPPPRSGSPECSAGKEAWFPAEVKLGDHCLWSSQLDWREILTPLARPSEALKPYAKL